MMMLIQLIIAQLLPFFLLATNDDVDSIQLIIAQLLFFLLARNDDGF